jgi:NADH-quinone oxidoreductase subunit A
MDLTASQETLGKEPGQDLREGVYTLPVLHALGGPRGPELREILRDGPPSGERVDRALEIVRAPGHLARARSAVIGEVDRAHGLTARLPDAAARGCRGTRGARADARAIAPRGRRAEREGRGRLLESALLGKTFTSVETYYQSYGVVLAVLIAGVGLVAVAFGAARLIAPRRPVGDKLLTYECGIDPVGEGWSQSQVRYYVYGFLFVIFDVESVFLFPWARIFESLGYQAVVEMAIFIGILAVGLLYAWRKGVLRWA